MFSHCFGMFFSCLSLLVVLQGAFIYEFGDHGGLIVMADDLKKTGEVREIKGGGKSGQFFPSGIPK